MLLKTPKTSSATHSNCEKADNKVLTLLAHFSVLTSNSCSVAFLSEVLDEKLTAKRPATSGEMFSILPITSSVRVWLLSRIRWRSCKSSLLKYCMSERFSLVSCTDATSPSSMAPSCAYRISFKKDFDPQSNFKQFGNGIREKITLPKSSAARLSSKRLSRNSPSEWSSQSQSSTKIVTIFSKNTFPSVLNMPATNKYTW